MIPLFQHRPARSVTQIFRRPKPVQFVHPSARGSRTERLAGIMLHLVLGEIVFRGGIYTLALLLALHPSTTHAAAGDGLFGAAAIAGALTPAAVAAAQAEAD